MRLGRDERQRHPAIGGDAFTLIELLVVIAIIAAISVISLPSLRGLGQSNVVVSGTQQLVDDLMLARHKAIVNRTVVHVVFVPPWANDNAPGSLGSTQFDREEKLWERLREGVYTTYALYSERTLGDQPGQTSDRYLTEWRTLPDGVFIGTDEYNQGLPTNFNVNTNALDRPFGTNSVPYPTANSPQRIMAPTISFDENGRLFQLERGSKTRRYREDCVEVARGSVLASRNGGTVDVNAREIPPGNANSTNNYNRIRIDAMSGRARLERPEIKLGD